MRPFFQYLNCRRRRLSLSTALLSALYGSVSAGDADQVEKYINDLKSGPAVYYTPEAAAYFATLGNYSVSGLSVDKDAAVRMYMATIKLGDMSLGEVRAAVGSLIDIFPKAVHVVEVTQARYAGEGTLEDCISTYVMSEKSKFMLSSPFLDYSQISICENFIDGAYETEMFSKRTGRSGAIAEATFKLRITFTFYAGECALSRLSGMSLGHDPLAWRQWWQSPEAGSTASATPTPITSASSNAPPPQSAVKRSDYSDIQVGGKYRVFLTTGDDLTGTVESRNDSSMVIETVSGKPYSFRFSLMQSYQTIEPPPPASPDVSASASSAGPEVVSYDDLRARSASYPGIEVRINNGSLFKGKLLGINDEGLTMDVEGSTIPISKDVINQIIVQSSLENRVEAVVKKPQGPFDTIWARNPQTDNYGNTKPDLLYTGTIIDESDTYVSLKDVRGGAPQKFLRGEISRYIRHSSHGSNDSIALYAKPLTCPAGMFFVGMPPGVPTRPFFKVCVDKYEYPNTAGTLPRTKISFEDAKNFCAKQGKRLCTSDEWMWACGGKAGLMYPYGKTFEQDRCNGHLRRMEASGQKHNCVSPFGGFDMVGNVYEWVTLGNGNPALMGGPVSKCRTVSAGENGDAKPLSGFRCCKSN